MAAFLMDPREENASEPQPEDRPFWQDLRDFYFTFDRRTLGLTRIFLGIFLIFDLFRRTGDWWKMYSNDGVLPTHYNLWRPQSNGWTLFNAFASREELWALWGFILVVYVCLLLGYKTRVMQVLAAIIVPSMNGRILLIENGGYVVHNLLLLWTVFLPLGDRFSLDALIASFREKRERSEVELNDRSTSIARWRLDPHVTVVGFVLLAQLSAIYFFNVVHKTGKAWHDGTAVHYVLYVDRMVNPLIGAIREHVPPVFILFMTRSTMVMEAGMPLALWSPIVRPWAKRVAIVFVNTLHLAFGTTFVLGPFAWALCVFSTLLVSTEDWEVMNRTMRRVHRAREVRYDPRSEAALWACRLLKRLDRFELLTFRADETADGIEVGALKGAPAAAEIAAALPLGPWLALPLRVPVLGTLLHGLFRGVLERLVFPPGYKPPLRPEIDTAPANQRLGWPEIREALDGYYQKRRFGWGRGYFGVGALVVGALGWVYAVPLLRRSEVDVRRVVFGEGDGGWTLEQVVDRGMLALALLGALLVLIPTARIILTQPSSAAAKRRWSLACAREAIIVVMAVGAVNQACVELWVTRNLKIPQPEATRVLSHKMRYLQGWFMFSPNPVMDDGTIVVDAITVDGRRIDPMSPDVFRRPDPIPPDFDLPNTKSYAYNQIWSDYYNRMHLPANTAYRKPFQEYIYRLPERTGNPNDAIVKGKVYWVQDMNPRFRRTKSYAFERKELFTFSNPDPMVQVRWRELTGGSEPPEAPVPAAGAETASR